MEIKKIELDPKETKETPNGDTPSSEEKSKSPLVAFIVIFVIIAGLGFTSGSFLTKLTKSGSSLKSTDSISGDGVKTGDIYGSDDESAFPDTAEGFLEKGGIEGEGTHKLLRAGGPDQTAYLTSSVVDLDEFVGHKIIVWGETFASQKAGWLMDVGRVKVEELNATPPEE